MRWNVRFTLCDKCQHSCHWDAAYFDMSALCVIFMFDAHLSILLLADLNGTTRPGGSGEAPGHRKPRNYKLIVDPGLKQGPNKIYRFDGLSPGVSSIKQNYKRAIFLIWQYMERNVHQSPKLRLRAETASMLM